ncbi:hypothetical protein RJD40_10625 [Vibrio scophthalmi]|uniref:hypothetical protein n=1 Tax=Vibrio scophthalmi TaxID=45658 RepID=UPI003AAC9374
MEKSQLLKSNQQKFNQAYLLMQNTLGGNPIALLNNDDCVQVIEEAAKALEQMHHIARECHGANEDDLSEPEEPEEPEESEEPEEPEEPESIVEQADKKAKEKKAKAPKATEKNEGSTEQ